MKRHSSRRSQNSSPKKSSKEFKDKQKTGKTFTSTQKQSSGKDKRFERPEQIVGTIVQKNTGWTLELTDRKLKSDRQSSHLFANLKITNTEDIAAHRNELAVAKVTYSGNDRGFHITKFIGAKDDPRNYTLIAVNKYGIPNIFPEKALEQARAATPVTLEGRVDLRGLNLVTIDGEDARDFDDAVFAELDTNPNNRGGFHLVVAIADVAHYVTPESPLDLEARERGNSVYFADRVVPMLPEELSNELCSLKPNIDRACMAVHLYISRHGELKEWKFVRGVMNSKARLTYTQVQAALQGKPDDQTAPLMETVIKPLHAAYKILKSASVERGAMNLNIPERKVLLDDKGFVKDVVLREATDSTRLIEEFMIAANVAAARQLFNKDCCVYRVHDCPTEEKLTSLRDFLKQFHITLAPGKDITPKNLNQVLAKVKGQPYEEVVNDVMLRSMAQACYSPDNIGHFGLCLKDYAHFTSPIRRYSDLLVHRALIKECKFGNDGISTKEVEELGLISAHISMTERRAMQAERETVDRFLALYLEGEMKNKNVLSGGKIKTITKSGLFVTLANKGAEGFVALQSLPRDHYDYNQQKQQLEGRGTGRIYQIGQRVDVKIMEVDPLTAMCRLNIVETIRDKALFSDEKLPRTKKQADRRDASIKQHQSKKITGWSPI